MNIYNIYSNVKYQYSAPNNILEDGLTFDKLKTNRMIGLEIFNILATLDNGIVNKISIEENLKDFSFDICIEVIY